MLVNTKPLELVNSALVTVVVVAMSLMWPAAMVLFALMLLRDSAAAAGVMCCLAVPIPPAGLALQALLRWSRRGQAHRYLEEVDQALGGGGTVSAATLLLPMLNPRLSATVDGHAVELMLRRTGGFLTSSRPGKGGLLPWQLQAQLSGALPGKIGFTAPDAATVGMGLLGLSNPQKREGVLVFAGDTPEVADDDEVLAAAAQITYGPTTLVMAGPDGLRLSHRLSDTTADALAAELTRCAALLTALESNRSRP